MNAGAAALCCSTATNRPGLTGVSMVLTISIGFGRSGPGKASGRKASVATSAASAAASAASPTAAWRQRPSRAERSMTLRSAAARAA